MASDPVTLGSTASGVNDQATYSHSTTAAVPSGGKLIVGVGWAAAGSSGSITSISAGALSLTRDHWVNETLYGVELWSVECPSGLAQSTTVTVDPSSGSCYGVQIHACYVEGVADTSYVDDTASENFADHAQAWSSGALDTTGEGVGVVIAFSDGLGTGSSSPDGNTTELSQAYESGDQFTSVLCYRRRADAGTVQMGGNWSADPTFADGNCSVAYKAAASSVTGGGGFRRGGRHRGRMPARSKLWLPQGV